MKKVAESLTETCIKSRIQIVSNQKLRFMEIFYKQIFFCEKFPHRLLLESDVKNDGV